MLLRLVFSALCQLTRPFFYLHRRIVYPHRPQTHPGAKKETLSQRFSNHIYIHPRIGKPAK